MPTATSGRCHLKRQMLINYKELLAPSTCLLLIKFCPPLAFLKICYQFYHDNVILYIDECNFSLVEVVSKHKEDNCHFSS